MNTNIIQARARKIEAIDAYAKAKQIVDAAYDAAFAASANAMTAAGLAEWKRLAAIHAAAVKAFDAASSAAIKASIASGRAY